MMRILIVEDKPLIALLAANWVEDLGHIVLGPAGTLSAAVDLANTTNIDSAIIDVSLGHESGVTLAQQLAARGVPFVFASGHAPADIGSGHLAAAILTKPFSFEAFKQAIDALTQEPRPCTAEKTGKNVPESVLAP